MDPSSRWHLQGSLTALSQAPDGDFVVVAGRDVLKIFPVYSEAFADAELGEPMNLRLGFRVHGTHTGTCTDVQWCPAYAKHLIATAGTNGAIQVWDVNRPASFKQERVLNEHSRAVNRLSFHSTEPILLVSAGQDGTMKLWDLRQRTVAMSMFDGKAESVRDVQFVPGHPNDFAAAFDNGSIQRWDIRNPRVFEKKWSAHNGPVLTVDWHPNGRYLASGGRDKLIKVWDMNQSPVRKPSHTIQTIAAVSRIHWRPIKGSVWGDGAVAPSDSAASTQLASCSLLGDNRIHVWDLNRPHVPYYSIEDHTNITTGFLWHDADTVWSVSRDQTLLIHFIHAGSSGFRPAETMSATAVSWNALGRLTCINKVSAQSIQSPQLDLIAMFGRGEPLKARSQSRVRPARIPPIPANMVDPSFNSLTWSGSSVPSNLGTLLNNSSHLADDDSTVPQQNEDPALDAVDEPRSFFSRKIPRKSGSSISQAASKSNIMRIDTFRAGTVQRGIELESQTFDYIRFTYYAQRCRVVSRASDAEKKDLSTIVAVCTHNARVASDLGDLEMSHVWTVSNNLFQNWLLPALYQSSKNIGGTFTWKPLFALQEAVLFYSKKGDLQSCSLLYQTFYPFFSDISRERSIEWLDAYIDQLMRMRLLVTAASMIKASPFQEIRSLNQESTTFTFKCAACDNPVPTNGDPISRCGNCNSRMNICSLCQEPVKGVYIWCRGCSHGGHLDHMLEWFQEEKSCPTGCGHECLFA